MVTTIHSNGKELNDMALTALTSDTSVFTWLIGILASGWFGLITWNGNRLVNRVDDLEKDTVSREDLRDLKDVVKEHLDRTRDFQEATVASLADNRQDTAVIIEMLKNQREA